MAKIDILLSSINIDNISDIHITSGLPLMVREDGRLIKVNNNPISFEDVKNYIEDLIPDKYEVFEKRRSGF